MATPAQDYAIWYQKYDTRLNKVLKAAAEDISKRMSIPVTGVGGQVRNVQLAQAQRAIKQMMAMTGAEIEAMLKTGRIGAAGLAGMSLASYEHDLLASVFSGPTLAAYERAEALRAQAGLEAAARRISGETQIPLSKQVYNTNALAKGWVDKAVNVGLAQGLSAAELAKTVKALVDPDVAGGVSYAARRLARTELNNAFHASAVARMKAKPWVEAVQWNLSGSHSIPDICNDYADGDGPDGTWDPGKVPAKPHPQCLCYVTPVLPTDDQFIENYVSGKYDTWLDKDFPELASAKPLASVAALKPKPAAKGPSVANLLNQYKAVKPSPKPTVPSPATKLPQAKAKPTTLGNMEDWTDKALEERYAAIQAERKPYMDALFQDYYDFAKLTPEVRSAYEAESSRLFKFVEEISEEQLRRSRLITAKPTQAAKALHEKLVADGPLNDPDIGDDFRQAMQRWEGDEYKQIQARLSALGDKDIGNLDDETKFLIEHIDEAMDPLPDGTTLYRGMTNLDDLQIGDTMRTNMYTATSTDASTAGMFSRSAGGVTGPLKQGESVTVMRIRIASEARGVAVPGSPEYEVILSRSVTLRVVKTSKQQIDGVDYKFIDVETVPRIYKEVSKAPNVVGMTHDELAAEAAKIRAQMAKPGTYSGESKLLTERLDQIKAEQGRRQAADFSAEAPAKVTKQEGDWRPLRTEQEGRSVENILPVDSDVFFKTGLVDDSSMAAVDAKVGVMRNLSRAMADVPDRQVLKLFPQPGNQLVSDVAEYVEKILDPKTVWYKRADGTWRIDAMASDSMRSKSLYRVEETRDYVKSHGGVFGGDPAFVKEMREQAISGSISNWANTSGDHDNYAIAVQRIAQRLFGIQEGWMPARWIDKQEINAMLKDKEFVKGVEAMLDAQYEATQKWFKDKGITHIYGVRGMSVADTPSTKSWQRALTEVTDEGWDNSDVFTQDFQPMSSWSTDLEVALQFTGSGDAGVIEAVIPVERILSVPRTGYGCLNESEMVVLAGRGQVRMINIQQFDEWA